MLAAKYKGCMSFDDTLKAWNMHKNGKSHIIVAMEFNIDVATLYRSYQHYGFQPPKHQNRRRKK